MGAEDGGWVCECDEGWMGESCSEDIDECEGNVCDEEGTYRCLNTHNGYSCTCKHGFQGITLIMVTRVLANMDSKV